MLIGRENEVRKLKDALSSASSEFIAVYGRRRVGKTPLSLSKILVYGNRQY